MSDTGRAGRELAESVLGAGLLLVPPLVAALLGPVAPAAWLVHLAGGALFSAALGGLALRRTGAASIAEVNGAVLGRPARRLTVGAYLVGFTVGQAAIALAAGGLLVVATGRPWLGFWAVLLLAAATAGAVAGVQLGTRARRWRLAATAAVALVAGAAPELYRGAGLLPEAGQGLVGARGGQFALAVFLLFFAGVGWEASARIMPGLRSRGRLLPAVGLGASLVGLAYLSLALLLVWRVDPAGTAPPPGPGLRTVAFSGALILSFYCVTNIYAAGRFLHSFGGPGGRWASLTVGTVGIATVGVATSSGWRVLELLLVPGLATWIGYLVASLAMFRDRSVGSRPVGGLLLAGLLLLLVAVIAPLI